MNQSIGTSRAQRGRLFLGVAALAGALSVAQASSAAAPAHPDFSGFWDMKFHEFVHMDDGKLPPMKPAAKAIYDERVAAIKAGRQMPDSATSCLPHGMPRIMYTPYPMQIFQQPTVIGMMFEVNHNQRIVYMDEKLPVDPDPTYMGYSVGHWEGQTLVIESEGMNDKIQIDRGGLPQSPKTHVTERLTLLDGGKRATNKLTITDDSLYTAPWSFTVEYRKTPYRMTEYVCDNNRAPTVEGAKNPTGFR